MKTAATAVWPGIYEFSVSMGNQFSTDYSATVGPTLMISDPYEFSIPIKCWKNQPSSTFVGTCAQKKHYAHNRFWSLLAQMCFGSPWGKFFPCGGNSWNLQGLTSNTTLGEHLSQNSTYLTPITPKFLQKCDLGGPKIGQQFVLPIFFNRAIREPFKNYLADFVH